MFANVIFVMCNPKPNEPTNFYPFKQMQYVQKNQCYNQ